MYISHTSTENSKGYIHKSLFLRIFQIRRPQRERQTERRGKKKEGERASSQRELCLTHPLETGSWIGAKGKGSSKGRSPGKGRLKEGERVPLWTQATTVTVIGQSGTSISSPVQSGQFHILRKLSHEPVATAMPSLVTPKQLTLLSCPAKTPAKERKSVSQSVQNTCVNTGFLGYKTNHVSVALCGADPPARSPFSVSHTLQLKSS